MLTDLVLSPFGADAPDMLEAARVADEAGFDTVWTYDHFGGVAVGAPWSRDPFAMLGAVAAVTTRVGVGVLVANASNRHPAQLASAVNTLQSLAPGRVRCGLGAGAGAGERFAAEQVAIGRSIPGAEGRRNRLVETIACLRAIWRGAAYSGRELHVEADIGVVDGGTELPPMIVGGSGEQMVRLAAAHADGINLRLGPSFDDLVALTRQLTSDRSFDIGVFHDLEPDHPLGGDPEPFVAAGVGRRTLAVKAPFPIESIATIGARVGQRSGGAGSSAGAGRPRRDR